MKIVIVGSGWLGKPLAEKMAENGNEVTTIYRQNKPEFHSRISTIQITENGSVSARLKEADYVVFCFPPPKEGKSHADSCIELARCCQANCRFVFTSTTGVYPNENKSFDETAILDASNKHVITEQKLQQEFGERLSIVRLAGLVGEGRFPVRMMSTSGKKYNYNEYCNLIHRDDAVGFLSFLIQHQLEVGIVNACAPIHPLKGEYYPEMAKYLKVSVPEFEKGPNGKLIQSDLSISIGYRYLLPDPFHFF